jgi:excinuclease ABC subunit C
MISKNDINSLPDKPGVYFFKDKSSQILYIGKAKFLKKRVNSYTHPSYRHSKRTRQLVRKVKKVDYVLCGSELEALLLESRLIKEHLPEYNIMQRRTKDYPFIKITMRDDFPRVFVAWDIETDNAKYLGPFPRWYEAQVTVDLIHKIFPIRKCSNDLPLKERKNPCLNFHIKQCLGPCCKKITKNEYRKTIGYIIRFLSGNYLRLIRDTEKEMKKAASDLKFERAARLRDQINGIKEVVSRHQFRVKSIESNNLIAVYPSEDSDSVEMFFIRKGILEDQKRISTRVLTDDDLSQNLKVDIQRIFFHSTTPDKTSVSRIEVDAMNIIARWLYRHRNDQSLIYIKGKRNKSEAINQTTIEVKKIIKLLMCYPATS